MRKLIGLMTLLAALGALAISVSGATASEGASAGIITPEAGVPFTVDGSTIVVEKIATPKKNAVAPLSLSQCSAGTMCVWSNNDYTGSFSYWNTSDTGCHSHGGNPSLRSGWNLTIYTARIGGAFYLAANEKFRVLEGNPITGEICFPA